MCVNFLRAAPPYMKRVSSRQDPERGGHGGKWERDVEILKRILKSIIFQCVTKSNKFALANTKKS